MGLETSVTPGFKPVNTNVKKGKNTFAFGSYPADRKFGSTVTRSVVEQYDLDSTWARWRRGMEYYFQAAYLEFDEVTLNSIPWYRF